MVKNDKELGQSGVDIRVWTGDTMTAASVYQQLVALPDLQQLFYIGANGKIGTAVCQKLVQRGISVRIFSKYEGICLLVLLYSRYDLLLHILSYLLSHLILPPPFIRFLFVVLLFSHYCRLLHLFLHLVSHIISSFKYLVSPHN